MEKRKQLSDKLKLKLKNVALLALDVDGVLTPPNLIYGTRLGDDEVFEYRSFNVHDGSACWIASEAGLILAIISGRESEAVRIRANKLKIEDIYLGHLNKLQILEELKTKYRINDDQISFVSDDYLDLPLLEKVGFPIAVNDAVEEVKNVAAIITEAKGGCGAVREVIKLILSEQGKWESSQEKVLQKIKQK